MGGAGGLGRASVQLYAARRCGQGNYLLKIRAVLLTLSWESWEKQTAQFPEERGGSWALNTALDSGVGDSCHVVTDRPVLLVGRCPEELLLLLSSPTFPSVSWLVGGRAWGAAGCPDGQQLQHEQAVAWGGLNPGQPSRSVPPGQGALLSLQPLTSVTPTGAERPHSVAGRGHCRNECLQEALGGARLVHRAASVAFVLIVISSPPKSGCPQTFPLQPRAAAREASVSKGVISSLPGPHLILATDDVAPGSHGAGDGLLRLQTPGGRGPSTPTSVHAHSQKALLDLLVQSVCYTGTLRPNSCRRGG